MERWREGKRRRYTERGREGKRRRDGLSKRVRDGKRWIYTERATGKRIKPLNRVVATRIYRDQ